MADQIQFRGGPQPASSSFVGAPREITVDTTDWTLRVHDGTTAGGHVLYKLSQGSAIQTALDADITAVENRALALESFQANVLAAIGITSSFTSLGGFTGSTFAENASVKSVLQAVETALENKATLLGAAVGDLDLGSFSGSTIADGQTVKQALQSLESALEAVDIDTDDLATLTGIAENVTNLGTFTGSTIADNLAVKEALQALETATELRATADSPAFTGELATLIGSSTLPVVHRIQGGFPDINLRTSGGNVAQDNNEGRLLWEDAGGGAVAAIKQTMLPTSPMRFFVGGITAADERLRITATGRVGIGNTSPQAALHVAGSALVQAEFPDFQMRSSGERRVIFEDNGGGAEGAIKFASGTMGLFAGGIAAADQILSLSASGALFGDKKVEISKDAFGLRLERISGTQFDIGTSNPPSGGNLNIKNSNGTDARVVVYSDLFWVRGLGGTNGNGNVKFDGTLDFDDVTLTGIQTSSESFSDDDVSLMTSAAINDLVATATTTLSDLSITATASELNVLDGITATTAELNHTDGVTSNIQTQLNALQAADAELTELATMASTAAAAIADLSATEIEILDGATVTTAELNILDGVTATTAELNYVDGVTSAIQTQLDAKYATSGGTLSGSVTISASYPDLTLKSNGERRLLFEDAGGGVNAGFKYASSQLQFLHGGVAAGNVIAYINDTSVVVNQDVYLEDERVYFNAGSQLIRLKDNQTSALKIENHDGSSQDFLDFKTANSGCELIFGAPNQFNNSITVGEDDTGYDVTFYGATASAYMQWDESADALVLAGSATLDVAGDIDVDGTANLDVIDVDGTANFASTVEVNDTLTMKANINFTGSGREIRFKDNTYNALRFQKEDGTTYMGFDSQGDATIFFSQPLDINTTAQFDGAITVGVDDTGHDVKFFGATASAYLLWDESEDDLILAGAARAVIPEGQLVLGSTAVTSTAAELNLLDGITAGTASASQAVILDANKDLTGLRNLTLTGNLTVQGTTTTVNTVTMEAANAVVFEGASADDHETTLTVIDPDADRTIKLPNQSGCLPVLAADSATQISATPEELNILDGVTATAAELNILDGVTATAAELNILDGVTSTAAELNILDGVTASAAELNILDGVTSTAAELNILDGVTATAAELNLLDGVTASTAELNYVDGVTSAIQTQLNAKLDSSGAQAALHVDHIITLSGVAQAADHLGTFTGSTISDNGTIKAGMQELESAVEGKQAADADLTNLAGCQSGASAAIAALTQAEVEILDGATVTTAELNILDGVTSTAAELNLLDGVTATTAELNYVDGVTSAIQTQLDAKAAAADSNLTGTTTVAAIDLSGDLDCDGTANLDAVDIDGDVDLAGDLSFSAAKDIQIIDNNAAALEIAEAGNNYMVFDSTDSSERIHFKKDIVLNPASSIAPAANGELVVEATNDTTITFKLKGSDGTVRTGTISLS